MNRVQVTILGVMLAVTLFAVALLVHEKIVASANQENELKLVAKLMASDHQAAVGGVRQLLLAISSNYKYIQNDTGFCNEVLRKETVVFPYFINIGEVDTSGKVICSALPSDVGYSVAHDPDFMELIQKKDFVISGYRISRITGWPSMRFFQPFFREDGTLAGAFFVTFATEWLNSFSTSFPILDNMIVIKFDKDGTVFMRYPNPTFWNGTDQSESTLFKKVAQVSHGILNMKGLDGQTRKYYIEPVFMDGKLNAYIVVGYSDLPSL